MEEADKDWMMIRMVGEWVFLLVPAHPGTPGQRAMKQLLLFYVMNSGELLSLWLLLLPSLEESEPSRSVSFAAWLSPKLLCA